MGWIKWDVLLSKALRRKRFKEFMAQLPPCLKFPGEENQDKLSCHPCLRQNIKTEFGFTASRLEGDLRQNNSFKF